MEKCQYIRERELPPMATKAEIDHVKTACGQPATASLGRSALASIAQWRIPAAQLRDAIVRHIEAGRRIFHKYEKNRRRKLIPDDVQANVTLLIDLDVYVEVWLMDNGMITIYAHPHTAGVPRLPQ